MKRLKKEPAGSDRERLLAVSIGMETDLSLSVIAKRMGGSRATIQSWISAYREGGIGQLCYQKPKEGGLKQALDERQQREFLKKLAKGSFRTGEQARDWVAKQFGVHRTASTVRRLMGKLGAGLKVVRPRLPNSSERRRFEFRHQLARQLFSSLKEGSAEGWKERPIRIWVADEARFGLQPSLRRAWVSRGVRAHKSSSCRYDWQYIWAAL